MNKKNRIIISVTGIVVVLLALLGLTYAYYLTRIDGNTNTNSISVTTADLRLTYADLTENIVLDKAMPNTIVTKQFTVTNDGTAKINDYQIYLENVVNELTRKEDLVYTLTCVTNDEVNSPCTNQINSEITFPSLNGVVITNSIDKQDVHTYTLTLKYKEMNVDQSVDMGKVISAKINIYDENSSKDLTLGHYILENGAQVLNTKTNEVEIDKIYTEKTSITKVANGTDMGEVGIFTAPDDYGTSYYYRGTVKNNYVNFAGFTWRIVRINGDGSVRLILNEPLDKICVEYKEDGTCKTRAGKTSSYNSIRDNNAYAGYMYGLALSDVENINQDRCLKLNGTTVTDYLSDYSTKELCEANGGKWTTNSYEATHANVKDSTIKTNVDKFYETHLENGTNKRYEKYLVDTLFCNDKILASDGIGKVTTQLGFGNFTTYYSSSERLRFDENKNHIATAYPSLKCAQNTDNNYSRMTAGKSAGENRFEIKTIIGNNISINNDLKYPIALLSADEAVLAGAWRGVKQTLYYLYDSYQNSSSEAYFWTMSPTDMYGGTDKVFYGIVGGKGIAGMAISYAVGVRPVINLKANLLVESGDGTKNGPYTLKEIN